MKILLNYKATKKHYFLLSISLLFLPFFAQGIAQNFTQNFPAFLEVDSSQILVVSNAQKKQDFFYKNDKIKVEVNGQKIKGILTSINQDEIVIDKKGKKYKIQLQDLESIRFVATNDKLIGWGIFLAVYFQFTISYFALLPILLFLIVFEALVGNNKNWFLIDPYFVGLVGVLPAAILGYFTFRLSATRKLRKYKMRKGWKLSVKQKE